MQQATDEIGFIGLGVMGQPMALNLARAGTKLVVWNRSPGNTEALRAAGAAVAANVAEVFARARTVFVMLLNESVTDAVLSRGTVTFSELVVGHTLVSMGSVSPQYSRELGADVQAAGGHFIESPVSGSRKPAEAGQLVALLGGEPQVVAEIRPLLEPMCRATVICGALGQAMLMKLAVNLYLHTMTVGLTEAVHFADKQGLDLNRFREAVAAGPMASDVTHVKLPKLINRDFSVQAEITDAWQSCHNIASAARESGIASPLLDLSKRLYAASIGRGNVRCDMISVIHAIEARTERRMSRVLLKGPVAGRT